MAWTRRDPDRQPGLRSQFLEIWDYDRNGSDVLGTVLRLPDGQWIWTTPGPQGSRVVGARYHDPGQPPGEFETRERARRSLHLFLRDQGLLSKENRSGRE